MQSTLAGIEKGFLQNGAFICWSCASSTLVYRLQSCQVFLTPPKIPDQLLTLRRILMKIQQLTRYSGLEPESQGQSLALIVSYVPYLLDFGWCNAYLDE